MSLPQRREIKRKERDELLSFEKFAADQGGIYPASLAAVVLRMSCPGVWAAGERGCLAFCQVGRVRYYGRSSVRQYQEETEARARLVSLRLARREKK